MENDVNITNKDNSFDIFLINTGMKQDQIEKLDPDIKEFIVNDMKNAEQLDFKFIATATVNTINPMANQVLSGIQFTVPVFKSGSIVNIYPTYEFTTNKKPDGNDSFSFQLGNALLPYNYGGQIWGKDATTPTWQLAGTLTANTQGFNGAEFSGNQLGNPASPILIKGATYCHANEGSGSDKRIIMSYMYNPNNNNYSISFSAFGIGIAYSSPNTIYTAAKTIVLSF